MPADMIHGHAAMSSTIRLPSALLLQANRFLLTLYAAADFARLRSEIPHGLGRLIAADRVSVNFVGFIETGQTKVVPANVPPYWSRLREVYCKYAHEHVLHASGMPLHRICGFSDPRADLDWKKAALYNEYYRPIGCHQHIGVNVFRAGRDLINVGFNRDTRDFCAEDRGLLQLLSPHLGNALHRARQLDPTVWPEVHAHPESSPGKAMIELDRSTGRVSRLSPTGTALILRYTGVDVGEGCLLPDPLRRWLAGQRQMLSDPHSLAHPAALILPHDGRRLTVTLGQMDAERETLLLREALEVRNPIIGSQPRLTRREQEVLNWLAEGKRNTEIAHIIGVGERTVEKHLEHIFAKLGTGTRTATMLRGIELQRISHA